MARVKLQQSQFLTTVVVCLELLIFLGYFFFLVYNTFFKNSIKSTRRNLIAIFLFVSIIIALEIFSDFLLHNPAKIPAFIQPAFANYYERYYRTIITYEKSKAKYDSTFFYMLKADTTFTFDNIEFHNIIKTNTMGLRDNNSSLVTPEVICLGDSYTMGWGVDEDLSFPDRLEKITGMNVLNTGVASFGTAREITLLNHLDTSKLKYLIIQYCSNDLPENQEYIKNHYRLKISPKKVYDEIVRQQPFNRKYFPGKTFLLTLLEFLKLPYSKIKESFKSDIKEEAKVFFSILIHSKINFKKIIVIVTYLDSYTLISKPFINHLQKLMQESPYKEAFNNNLKLLDVSTLLSKDDYFILDSHLKASGQEKVANSLKNLIDKMY
ncbi:MAG: hypothetical protein M3Z01_00650 [Thermoproteota archaeon]|nr:hypothetical protein [Thermoproteota archaeon]